jgi:hypothetical protein
MLLSCLDQRLQDPFWEGNALPLREAAIQWMPLDYRQVKTNNERSNFCSPSDRPDGWAIVALDPSKFEFCHVTSASPPV